MHRRHCFLVTIKGMRADQDAEMESIQWEHGMEWTDGYWYWHSIDGGYETEGNNEG